MTHSGSLVIVMPLVALGGMALWLGLVYYAAAHPQWKSQRAARHPDPAAAEAAEAGEQAAPISDRAA